MSFSKNDGFYDHICSLCKHQRRWHGNVGISKEIQCFSCDKQCNKMIYGNLEYLEWKWEQSLEDNNVSSI